MVVHQCHKCFRAKPDAVKQQMGDLPASRVTVAWPFSRSGVDFFGPVYLSAGRRRSPVKSCVEIFICMSTKAVHMRIVSDLSTERFLQALRSFFARRCMCSDIYSDNGKKFEGARNQMEDLFALLRDTSPRRSYSGVLQKQYQLALHSTIRSPFWQIMGGSSPLHQIPPQKSSR